MSLLFSQLCDLLSSLEELSKRDPPLLPARLQCKTNDTIKSWFISHRISINSDKVDAVTLLSALYPTKRTDRVFNIQPPRLSRCLRRWLCLGKTRWPLLDQWQQPGRGDLGACVERALQQAEFPTPHFRDRVTLEQVDNALATVAARCRFSAPKVWARGAEDDAEALNTLENLYQKLYSRDAKWLTRLVLKDFSCLDLPENLIYACIDPRLQVAMQMYHNFESAVSELRNLPASQMADSAQGGFTQQCANNAHLLPPRIGVKVGAPKWIKAKGGVKHAVTVIDGRTMSVERKHDGEYCQIHIDLSKGEDCIQIFSKSGKDSTEDRQAVHKAIKDSLRIGLNECRVSKKCILEGELLVYSDRDKEILDFYKIRKHVSRSGSFLGTALDSQPHYWEHLMIVFYDVMLIDDESLIHQPYTIRRRRLESLVRCVEGRSDVVYQEYIDFSKTEGSRSLKEFLAFALAQRWEGLVLKPSDEPYFDLANGRSGRFPSRWIKLKKDCIKGLGDTADFAVIGAGYDVRKATKHNLPNLHWTHFYLGCLRNKKDVLQLGSKPCFLVFDEISDCIKEADLKTLNELGHIRAIKPNSLEARDLYNIETASGLSGMKDIFRVPFVFDVAGSGFDKAPNRDIFSLRFPRVMKIHWDRDWKQSVGLEELQQMAVKAMKVPPKQSWREERLFWEDRLFEIDKGSKGCLNSWDVSDDEDEDAEPTMTTASMLCSSRGPRHSRANAAPSLVRMDTIEMKEGELRLSDGEVVERPILQYSIDSTTTNGSLPTPPTSSAVSNGGSLPAQPQSPPNPGNGIHEQAQKRSPVIVNHGEVSASLKRRQPSSEQSTSASPKPVNRGSKISRYQRPLHEIRNSTYQSPIPAVHQSSPSAGRSLRQNPSFVRKVPVGADKHFHKKPNKRRIIEEPFSPARETTASERTGTTTSQSTTSQSAMSQHTQAPHGPTTNAGPLPTPPSTASRPSSITFPNLQSSKIILSPSTISNHAPIPSLNHLLTTYSLTPSSLRRALLMPRSNPILHSTPLPTKQILLLVDSYDTEGTSGSMRQLVKNVPIWHPMGVEVWDWRVLELSGKERRDEEKVEGFFYAGMKWYEEGVGEGDGMVEVKWRDGRVMRVDSEGVKEVFAVRED